MTRKCAARPRAAGEEPLSAALVPSKRSALKIPTRRARIHACHTLCTHPVPGAPLPASLELGPRPPSRSDVSGLPSSAPSSQAHRAWLLGAAALALAAARAAAAAKSCAELGWKKGYGAQTAACATWETFVSQADRDPEACASNLACGGTGFTHAAAAAKCRGGGGRLCSACEYQSYLLGANGCGYDDHAIWTSTPCTAGWVGKALKPASTSAKPYILEAEHKEALEWGADTPFTVEAWVKTSAKDRSIGHGHIYASQSSNSPRSTYFSMEFFQGKALRCNFVGGRRRWPGVTSDIIVPVDTWTHVACAREADGRVVLFINGQPGQLSAVNGGSGDLKRKFAVYPEAPMLGKNPATGSEYVAGSIRSFRVTKGKALYTTDATGAPVPFEPPQLLAECAAGTTAGKTCVALDTGSSGAKGHIAKTIGWKGPTCIEQCAPDTARIGATRCCGGDLAACALPPPPPFGQERQCQDTDTDDDNAPKCDSGGPKCGDHGQFIDYDAVFEYADNANNFSSVDVMKKAGWDFGGDAGVPKLKGACAAGAFAGQKSAVGEVGKGLAARPVKHI